MGRDRGCKRVGEAVNMEGMELTVYVFSFLIITGLNRSAVLRFP